MILLSIFISFFSDTLISRQYTLDSVVVNSEKLKPVLLSELMPIEFVSINSDNITGKSLPDIFTEEIPGINIQKTNGGGGSLNIRGLSSSQILLKLDGIRLNNSTYRLGNHQYLNTIDPFSIDHISIGKMPASVYDGSDAFGGVVAIQTLCPTETQLTTFNVGHNSGTEHSYVSATINIPIQDHLFLVGFSMKSFGNIKRGQNYSTLEIEKSPISQSPNGYDERSFFVKYKKVLGEVSSLTLFTQVHLQSNIPRYDKYENENYHQWIYPHQNRYLAYAKYETPFFNFKQLTNETSLSFQLQNETKNLQLTPTTKISQEVDAVRTLGVQSSVYGLLQNIFLISGIDYYRDQVESFGNEFSSTNQLVKNHTRGRYPDQTIYQTIGSYISMSKSFLSDWKITGGLRYAYSKVNIPNKDAVNILSDEVELKFPETSVSLSLQKVFTGKLKGQLSYSQGFRSPNVNDLAKFGESKGKTFEVPNYLLHSEISRMTDLSLFYSGTDWDFQTSLYFNYLDDLIDATDGQWNSKNYIYQGSDSLKVKHKSNVGEGFISGYEQRIAFFYNEQLKWIFGFSFIYGENITTRKPLSSIPPIKWSSSIHAKYSWGTQQWILSGASKQQRLSPDDMDDPRIPNNGTPSWWKLSVHHAILFPKWSVHLNVENLFDANYRQHGSGINSPGRSILIGVRTSF